MQTTLSEGLINKNELVRAIIKPTRRRKRFFNMLLDGVVLYIFFAIISTIWTSTLISSGDISNPAAILNTAIYMYAAVYAVYFGYYIFFEYKFGKTIGKMATNTKVVRKDGTKPTLTNIIGRNFARLIPFEPLSLLFSHLPVGWHDSLSGTIVVDDIALYNIEKTKEKTEESF
jgi:uncharacterized RDD family membrane protein YckC